MCRFTFRCDIKNPGNDSNKQSDARVWNSIVLNFLLKVLLLIGGLTLFHPGKFKMITGILGVGI